MDTTLGQEERTTTRNGQVAPPCAMVIFGAAGDLTRRKLIPALYNVAQGNLLSREFAVVGVARADLNDESFRARLREDMAKYATGSVDPEIWEWLERHLYYVRGNFSETETYENLRRCLDEVESKHNTRGNVFYYLATAPDSFSEIVRHLGAAGMAQEQTGRFRRVIVEKPFGRDLNSARQLNRELAEVLGERQIYRIDHYLGKETVQNILVFRFANGIFEPIWNRQYIDHVQIMAAETVGVEGRGNYYEHSGALRDMVPNHLFQLMSLTAMEPPVSFAADSVRDEQAKILEAVQPLEPEEVLRRAVRGQYGAGAAGEDRYLGYRTEPGVGAHSSTETYVALRLQIENWRWAGVPFYLRTGKRMGKRTTEIAIQFKRAPLILFRDTPVDQLMPNRLIIQIQPEEGISLSFGAKRPGPIVQLGSVNMHFDYTEYFGATPATGYERLLYDCMCGDATLFQRADMVDAAWRVVSPIQDVWSALPPRNFPNYAAGSWGPREADELLEREGRQWRRVPA
jgi:glucose-6-phosphate 1-dehydrogenase